MASRASVPLVRECKTTALRAADLFGDGEPVTRSVECLPSTAAMEVEAARATVLTGPGAGRRSGRGRRLQITIIVVAATVVTLGSLAAVALRG